MSGGVQFESWKPSRDMKAFGESSAAAAIAKRWVGREEEGLSGIETAADVPEVKRIAISRHKGGRGRLICRLTV